MRFCCRPAISNRLLRFEIVAIAILRFGHLRASPPDLFEPGFGAYQGLAQKIKVPFSRIFSFFLQFRGFEGDFTTRAKPRYAPNSG